ncbi:hypothetical protein BC831DRAFT_451398 [Entophlyctis helioformis]|nr:hypothetical protein BC831DRAFT_451398 [Entophlyctis helioformis]
MVNFAVNSPLPSDVGSECAKCADILNHFVKPEKGRGPDQLIPPHILLNAKGVAVLTVIKAGFLFSGRGGSGLVVARLPDGSWSAPSAIGTAGMGVGGQIGAEITDFVIILNTDEAVRAFSKGGNVTLGGNLSVAAGPYGRNAEASGTLGHLAAVYSYSKTKGLFAGISIEGSVILERKETNAAFYNERVSAKQILSGAVEKPAAAGVLYRALDRRVQSASLVGGGAGAGGAAENGAQNGGGASQLGQGARPSSFAAAMNSFGRAPSYKPPAAAPPSSTHSSSSSPPLSASSTGGIGNVLNRASVLSAASNTTTSTANASVRRTPPPLPPGRPSQTARAVALYDFVGETPTDLSFSTGDIITVTKRTDTADGWWQGECNGRKGDFPGNYVQMR